MGFPADASCRHRLVLNSRKLYTFSFRSQNDPSTGLLEERRLQLPGVGEVFARVFWGRI